MPWAVATDVGSNHCQVSPHVPAAFAVSFALHNTTGQVSPNKWLLLYPHVRAEIRHWRETYKQRQDQNQSKSISKGKGYRSIV